MKNLKKLYKSFLITRPSIRLLWWLGLILVISITYLSTFSQFTEAVKADPIEATRIAYWQLEEAGSPYVDNEQAIVGTCTDCPTPVDGQVGNGQQFDGADDTITIAANNVFDWTTDNSFTIELWLKADAGACASSDQYAFARGSSGSGHWAIGCSATTGTARFELSTTTDNTVAVESTRIITDGAWHHLVAIYDAGTGSSYLYLDRTEVASAITNFTPGTAVTAPTAELQIGGLGSSLFAGVVDEVALYDGRLSDAHIGAHYYLSRPYDNLCSPDIRIMPLGDSITRGISSESPQAGYRKALYDLLTADELNFDFVGSEFTGGSTFDADHQATGGATAAGKAAVVFDRLMARPADIVLVHLGTNDLDDGFTPVQTAAQIETLLDEIDRYDERTTVILAQIINRLDGNHQPTSDFNDLLEPMVAQRLTSGDKLILVNMETGANLIYDLVTNGGDMANDGTGLHLAGSGYNKMATAWYEALTGFLSVCAGVTAPETAPTITSTPFSTQATVGAPYTYQVTASGNPVPTFELTTNPVGMNINSSSGLIDWTPAAGQTGNNNVTVRAFNSLDEDTQSFTLTVSEPAANPPPVCQLSDTLAYWRFDDGTFTDDYGGNNGGCTSCPTFTEQGRVNGAFTFNGSNSRVNVPANPVFNWAASDSFSIEAWVNIPSAGTPCSGGRSFISRLGNTPTDDRPFWGIGCLADNTPRFVLRDSDNNEFDVVGTTALNNNQWHHVVGVRDGASNQMRLYINGIQEGPTTTPAFTTGFTSDRVIAIGYVNFGGSPFNHFTGTLDEIAIHDRALTAAEIQRHYDAGLVNLGYEYDNWTTVNGGWNISASWYGNVPGITDTVAIFNNTNLTQPETAACVDVMPNATLDFDNNELTVEGDFNNWGTVKQTKEANAVSTLVEFLHVQNAAQDETKYRGVEITPAASLGNVEVTIRAADFDSDDYCTTTGADGGPPYAERCFTITPGTNGAASVRLYAHTNELAGLLVGDLRPYRFISGTGWDALTTNLATGPEGDFVYAQADTPGFSSFLLGGDTSPTAVSLANISATTGALPSAPITLLALGFLLLGSGMVYARRRILP